jgi:predicted nucleotidyltransferase
MESRSIPLSIEELKAALPSFCQRHGIERVEVFGSLARGDARVDSDLDLMVTFRSDVHPGLEFFGMADELESLLGCEVSFVTRRAVEADANWIRRQSILESAREVYSESPGDEICG